MIFDKRNVPQAFGIKDTSLLSTSYAGFSSAMVVKNGVIQDLGPSDEVVSRHSNVLFFDGSGFTLTPGLINAHTHVAMSFFRDLGHQSSDIIKNLFFPAEAKLNAKDVEILSSSSIVAGLQSGVTTFVDHYYFSESVAKALDSFGVRGVVGETVADLAGPFSGAGSWEKAREIIENWKWSDRITPAVCPHAMDTVSVELMREVSTYANKNNLPLHFHLSQTQSEKDLIQKRHGVSPVELAHQAGALGKNSLIVHLVSADKTDVEFIKKSEATIGFCPASQMIYEKLSPIEIFFNSQIPLALGTDSAGCNDGMDLMAEIKTFGLVARDRGFDHRVYQKIFDSVTSIPAKVLGLNSLGDFKVGFKADLTFFENDLSRLPIHNLLTNFIFSTQSRHVRHVMVDGKWVLFDRDPVLVNKAEIQGLYLETTKKYF